MISIMGERRRQRLQKRPHALLAIHVTQRTKLVAIHVAQHICIDAQAIGKPFGALPRLFAPTNKIHQRAQRTRDECELPTYWTRSTSNRKPLGSIASG